MTRTLPQEISQWSCRSSSGCRSLPGERSPGRDHCTGLFQRFMRQATKDAGRIAGLEVLRIINEPRLQPLHTGSTRSMTRRYWYSTLAAAHSTCPYRDRRRRFRSARYQRQQQAWRRRLRPEDHGLLADTFKRNTDRSQERQDGDAAPQ